MKKYLIGALVLVVLLAVTLPAAAVGFYPLPEQTQAHMNATHVAVLKGGDWSTASTTNGAVTNTLFTAQAGEAVELVAMTLPATFDTGYTNGLAVTCGDTNSATQFLASTQLGPTSTVTIAFGKGVYNSGAATNVTLTETRQVYSQATAIRAIVTPDTTSAAKDFTKGEVRFYFRKFNRLD